MEDYDLILGQQLQFHKDVLKNEVLVGYASRSLAILSQYLGSPVLDTRRRVADLMRRIVKLTRQVPTQLVKCASLGLLDEPTRLVIRRRWVRLGDMTEDMFQRGLLTADEQVVPWSVIADQIDRSQPAIDAVRGGFNNSDKPAASPSSELP
ncbi:hypothetical protein LTR55_000792, partial [Exophiala xenobiotica]